MKFKRHKISKNADTEILSYLLEKYGTDTIVNHLNEYGRSYDDDDYYDSNNSDYYGGKALNFRKTNAYKERRYRGFMKSLPGLALTAMISLPLALLMGIGILNERCRQRWQRNNGWVQRIFNPNYWTEYYANVHHKRKSKEDNETDIKLKENNWRRDDDTDKIIDIKTGEEITEEMAETMLMNKAFNFYWIILSTNEVLRVRASDEDSAKLFAEKIIKDSIPSYKQMKERKVLGKQDVYDIYFDDGEYAIWVAPDEETAKKECLKARVELSQKMNDGFTNKCEDPKIISCRLKRTTDIEYPSTTKYKITTVQPNIQNQVPGLDHIYEYSSSHEYKIVIKDCYKILFPAASPYTAKDFLRKICNPKSQFMLNAKNILENKNKLFKVTFEDNDEYIICAPDIESVKRGVQKLRNDKDNYILSVSNDTKERTIFKQIIADNPTYNKIKSINEFFNNKRQVNPTNNKNIVATITLMRWDIKSHNYKNTVTNIKINLT
jgi:hypothetical protein